MKNLFAVLVTMFLTITLANFFSTDIQVEMVSKNQWVVKDDVKKEIRNNVKNQGIKNILSMKDIRFNSSRIWKSKLRLYDVRFTYNPLFVYESITARSIPKSSVLNGLR